MTKTDIISLFIKGAMYDSWCQECGLENIAKALYRVLKAENIPFPEFLLKNYEISFLEEELDSCYYEES